MSNEDERTTLLARLVTYRGNLSQLEDKVSFYGNEMDLPIRDYNLLATTRKEIAQLEARLQHLDTLASVDVPNLRELLVQYFNDSELRTICSDLGIDYENLLGSTKSDKARELISYMRRLDTLDELIAICRRLRPRVAWPDATIIGSIRHAQSDTRSQQTTDRSTGTPSLQTDAPIRRLPTQVTLSFQLQDDQARITWESALLGSRSTTFTPPYGDDMLPIVIKALDAAQYPNHPRGGPQFNSEEQIALARLGLWQNDRVPASAHKTVGQALYQALGTDGRSALETVRSIGIAQGLQTSYVLRFPREAVSLAALPWEALWDQDQAVLLSRGHQIDSCERYMLLDRALPPPLHPGQQPHLLALTPSFNMSGPAREAERSARQETWESLKQQRRITYDEVGGPLTVRKLTDYLRKAPRRPDIIHYFGHGSYRNGEGYLLFDDGVGGASRVSGTRLAAILGDVRLIVLLACESATITEEGGLLTGVAPALSLVTGAVVAMQLTVRTSAAIRFSEIFYDELLAAQRSLQDAVAAGRQTLFFEEEDGASWYVPTLYIRSREQKQVYVVGSS